MFVWIGAWVFTGSFSQDYLWTVFRHIYIYTVHVSQCDYAILYTLQTTHIGSAYIRRWCSSIGTYRRLLWFGCPSTAPWPCLTTRTKSREVVYLGLRCTYSTNGITEHASVATFLSAVCMYAAMRQLCAPVSWRHAAPAVHRAIPLYTWLLRHANSRMNQIWILMHAT